jgi:dipeptidase
MKKTLTFLMMSSLGIGIAFGQSGFETNCFSILVGRKASADGSVFFAHNEDDLNDHNYVDLHKVPRIRHAIGEKQYFLYNTDSIAEVPETHAYFWITGSKYIEEQYLNEWGVAVTSNSSQSKVQNGNGKIGHNLRKIVIERARTAREAVKVAGSLVDTYGYASSGRVYLMADPNEAWVFEAANGKHWIARRVPDDEVVIVPNFYVIDDFNKSDTLNYLASPDIVEYAVENGWYDPRTDRTFNFRKVYGHGNRLDANWNIARKLVILNQLSDRQYRFDDDFPFSFKPKRKISLQMLMTALQNHYTDPGCEYMDGTPHHASGFGVKDTLTVCNLYNDYSCVTQLRNWLPPEIGNINWIAPRYPCIQPFIPWYYGIDKISPNYEKDIVEDALANFNNKNRNYFELYPDHACWVFDAFANKMDSCYAEEIKAVGKWKADFQKKIFKTVGSEESEIVDTYRLDPGKALRELTELSNHLADQALEETKDRLRKPAK